MWTSLKKMFDGLLDGETEPLAPDEFQLAVAALLVHVAAIDGDYAPEEQKQLEELMKRHFDLTGEQVDTLVAAARQREEDSIDIYSFTRVLTRRLGQEGRKEIVEMLWEMAFADGRLDEYESNLVWRASELLGVSRQDRLELKSRVKVRLGASQVSSPE
jgi:uncharacterized tellurite resistance protein B-like protein